MVYFPRPNYTKKVIDEFLGFVAVIFIGRLVVATTGGSLAFSSNLSQNAMANGIGFAVVYSLWPHVILDLTLLICCFFDDMVKYFTGIQAINVLDLFLYFVLAGAQFLGGLVAYLLIWVFVDPSVSDLGIPVVPSSVNNGRAFVAEAVLSTMFVFGFFYISQIYNNILLQGKIENIISQKESSNYVDLSNQRRVNASALSGVFTYTTGSWLRGILIGLLRTGLALGGITISGGLFNTFGYVTGGIVSWTWAKSYYVHAFGPLLGIVGYLAYFAAHYIPQVHLYELFFGQDSTPPEQLASIISEKTKLPRFSEENGTFGNFVDDTPDFYVPKKHLARKKLYK